MSDQQHKHSPELEHSVRRAFHEGRPEAVDAIATQYFSDVFRFSMSLLNDEETAMEAVQETFLRVVERHRLYEHTRPFRPWLFTICRNCCLTLLRQGSSRANIVELEEEQNAISELSSQAPTAIETLLREESENGAVAALQELPEARRTVVFLHLFEDMTFQEIATVTATPAPSVATLYYRALVQLRKRLIEPVPSRREQHHAG